MGRNGSLVLRADAEERRRDYQSLATGIQPDRPGEERHIPVGEVPEFMEEVDADQICS